MLGSKWKSKDIKSDIFCITTTKNFPLLKTRTNFFISILWHLISICLITAFKLSVYIKCMSGFRTKLFPSLDPNFVLFKISNLNWISVGNYNPKYNINVILKCPSNAIKPYQILKCYPIHIREQDKIFAVELWQPLNVFIIF